MKRRAFIAGGITMAALSRASAVQAQKAQSRVPTVGILWHAGNEEEEAPFLREVRLGLNALGYTEEQNIKLLNTYAGEQYQRFADNAARLVAQKVDLIVAVTQPAALAAQRATASIPIVAVVVSDPVGSGLVASLAHPGGNITGLSNMGPDLVAKRVELLKEALPKLEKVVVFVNPGNPSIAKLYIAQSTSAAERLKLETQIVEVKRPDDLDSAFASISPSGLTGIAINNDSLMFNARARIAQDAADSKLPTIVFSAVMAKAGALMSYGPNIPAIFRRSATYVDKILKGAYPAELPVEQPTDYDLVVNIRAAKSLGLALPSVFIARADEVIE